MTTREAWFRVAREVVPDAVGVRATPLTGGISSTTTRLDVDRAGAPRRLVVRVPTPESQVGPDELAIEIGLLGRLHQVGLRVPEPLHLDAAGELLGRPLAILGFIEGETCYRTDDPARLAQLLARQLAIIHDVDPADIHGLDLPARAQIVEHHLDHPPDDLDASLSEEEIRAVLDDRREAMWDGSRRLLHGDFWPGNVLFADGRINGVIDWDDAALGHPLADVGVTRLDLWWVFGPDVAATFTDAYLIETGADGAALPLWDVVAAFRPCGALATWASGWAELGRPDITEATMRRDHRAFLAAARGEV